MEEKFWLGVPWRPEKGLLQKTLIIIMDYFMYRDIMRDVMELMGNNLSIRMQS